eukprot:TRINITY_DN23513_c0_g1_i1.p1 TRINITY_DN23513_c0_g1~~TRINITY_DN23513_c0_g1_i1.p1  ORF type:complete len:298 (-),score=71.20 TRINITY_DN23513_c0_g1_i1:83-925(-)
MAEAAPAVEELQSLAETVVALDEQSAVSVICSVLESRPELAPTVVAFCVPDLTYPPAKAITERRSVGFVKSFNREKGFGFIACEELSEVFGNDVFIVAAQLGEIPVGSEVSFAVALNKDNKPQAYDVVPAGGWGASAPQAAPARSWPAQNSSYGGGKPSYKSAAPKRSWEESNGKGGGWAAPAQAKGGSKGGGKDIGKGEGEYSGFIKSFNHNNGYGFIDCEDLRNEGYNNDVFLHKDQLGDLQVGSEVVFGIFFNQSGKPQARDVMPDSGGGAKRQRTW